MDSDSDTDNYCSLYTSAGTYYKAITDSVHLNIKDFLREEEEKGNEKKESCLDSKKSKRNEESSNAKSTTKTKTDDIPTSEETSSSDRGRGRRRGRVTRSNASVNKECNDLLTLDLTSVEKTPPRQQQGGRGRKRGARGSGRRAASKQFHVIGPTIVLGSPESPKVTNDVIPINDSDVDSDSDTTIPAPITEENEEMSVKVWWQFSRFDRFTIRKFQKLESIFEHYSKLEKVPASQVLLLINDTHILPTDTPDSLKLNAASIIEAGVISYDEKGEESTSTQVERALNEDEIELKVQRKGQKKPLVVRIKKTQKMQVLMWKCAEDLNVPAEKLKFFFDGEALNPNDTPEDLDLEGGECVDLHAID